MRVRTFSVLPSVALLLMLVASSRESRADTIFSNLGPGQTYAGSSWWITGAVPPPPTNSNTEVNAFSFTPTETALVTGADLALAGLASSTTALPPVTVYIESNSAAGQPGTILATLTQSGTVLGYPVTTLENFTCSGTCGTLDAGTTYWIVAQETDPTATSYWMWNTTGDYGTWYFNYGDDATGPWTVAAPSQSDPEFGAFDVTGTAAVPISSTPEPGSLALVGSGLVGIAAALRRRAWRRQRVKA